MGALAVGMCAIAPKQGACSRRGCNLQELHLYTDRSLPTSPRTLDLGFLLKCWRHSNSDPALLHHSS